MYVRACIAYTFYMWQMSPHQQRCGKWTAFEINASAWEGRKSINWFTILFYLKYAGISETVSAWNRNQTKNKNKIYLIKDPNLSKNLKIIHFHGASGNSRKSIYTYKVCNEWNIIIQIEIFLPFPSWHRKKTDSE